MNTCTVFMQTNSVEHALLSLNSDTLLHSKTLGFILQQFLRVLFFFIFAVFSF